MLVSKFAPQQNILHAFNVPIEKGCNVVKRQQQCDV